MADVFELSQQIRLIQICQLTATVVNVYEHLITFDQEIELIWKKRWSVANILFLWTRYLGHIVLIFTSIVFYQATPSEKVHYFALSSFILCPASLMIIHQTLTASLEAVCFAFFRFQGWGSTLLIWVLQANMQLRIFVMYKKSRRILTFMLVCFAAEMIAAFVLLVLMHTQGFDVNTQPVLGVHFCTATNVPAYFPGYWPPILAFDCILFALSLWVGVQHLSRMNLTQQYNGAAIANVMMRDSIFYYFATLVINTTTAIVWFTLPAIWFEIPQGFSVAAASVMGCRLFLNLREAYFLPFEDEVDMDDVDDIVIARLSPIESQAYFSRSCQSAIGISLESTIRRNSELIDSVRNLESERIHVRHTVSNIEQEPS